MGYGGPTWYDWFGITNWNSSGSDKKEEPAPAPAAELPKAPSPEASQAKAEDMNRRRKGALSAAGQTLYTSPLGVAGQAQIAKKTLLGQ